MTTPAPATPEPATPRTDEIDSSHGHLIPVAMLPGGPATEEVGPAVPEPSHAERARTLAADATRGTLATLASGRAGAGGADLAGFPYPAVANVVTAEDGSPVVFVSTLAPHTRHLHRDPRASVLLAEEVAAGADRLAASRVSVMGTMELLPRGSEAFAAARDRYLAAHPSATYVDYHDFECWRMRVEAVRYIGGFGRMGWVGADGYAGAEPDPLRAVAAGAIEHLNADHADALRDCARALAGLPGTTGAVVVALDRYGMDLQVYDGGGRVDARVAFEADVADPDSLRRATVVLTHRARTLITEGGHR